MAGDLAEGHVVWPWVGRAGWEPWLRPSPAEGFARFSEPLQSYFPICELVVTPAPASLGCFED